jgi:hypothetical protein
MNDATMREAEAAAREFLKRCKDLRADESAMRWLTITGGMKSAAVRRQSMELTRALARMRQSI